MRKAIVLIVLLFSLLTCAGAQEANSPPLITVSGEAEVRVVPDEVVLTLGVETSSKNLAESKAQNDERAKRVLALGREFGIEARHMQTDYIAVEPWHRDSGQKLETLEYRVRKTIVLTLRETAKFEDLLSRALEAGATHVHDVQFRTTELHKYREQARALAIRAAREKAVALASELGQKIGRAYRVMEYGGGWFSPYGAWWGGRYSGGLPQISVEGGGGGLGSGEGAFALGQITVTAHVTVSFLLE